MRVALCQLNPVVGDFQGNLERLDAAMRELAPAKPDLVVLPELFLCGYPPLDLLSYPWFADACEEALEAARRLSARFPDTGIVLGAVTRSGLDAGTGLHNCAVLLSGGQELLRQPKTLLPTYDVFDEARWFDPAAQSRRARFGGRLVGLSVCEDAWNPADVPGPRRYRQDPVADLARAGADLLVNIAASPFARGREEERMRLMRGHARRFKLPLVFVNQVGANDELVFDGRSFALDRDGRVLAALGGFDEQTEVVDLDGEPLPGAGDEWRPEPETASVYRALVLGVRDYCRKCGFEGAVLGLSGGVDSALCAAIAADALGPANVLGVTMPSRYSSPGSVIDSAALAQNLGIEFLELPIRALHSSFRRALKPAAGGREPAVVDENIQARVRGSLLMAISNRDGRILLATGNKSELAVGYCTLYGDMCGGLAVLADVPKTMVYELARHVNRERELIPRSTIEKPPSAELRPSQRDADSLPPYDLLDAVLERYVEQGLAPGAIAAQGFDRAVVERVVGLVDRNEFKRRQAAPGLRVTSRAFGMGRRMPIAVRFRPA